MTATLSFNVGLNYVILTRYCLLRQLHRISEDLLDSVSSKCGGSSVLAPPGTVCNVYLNHLPRMVPAYRKYLGGLQKADCLLVTKTGSSTFMRLLTDPPIPRRSPDLTTLLHAPLEVRIFLFCPRVEAFITVYLFFLQFFWSIF